jgi:hypothetical protein
MDIGKLVQRAGQTLDGDVRRIRQICGSGRFKLCDRTRNRIAECREVGERAVDDRGGGATVRRQREVRNDGIEVRQTIRNDVEAGRRRKIRRQQQPRFERLEDEDVMVRRLRWRALRAGRRMAYPLRGRSRRIPAMVASTGSKPLAGPSSGTCFKTSSPGH